MKISISWDSGKTLEYTLDNKLNIIDIPTEADAQYVIISGALHVADIHSLWYDKSMAGPSQNMEWNAQFTSAQHAYTPYMAFFNRSSILRAAFGLNNLIDDAEFTAKLNQQNCTYDIQIKVALSPETAAFQLYADLRRDISFFDSLAQWRDWVDVKRPEFPAAAWEPVFCTWYAVHAGVSQQWVEKIAPQVHELGFRTLIIDDGWAYDDFKRVTPETLVNWYDKAGDWDVSPVKFPDFKNHVKKIQSLGMKYMVWVAPHMIGVNSRFHAENRHAVLPLLHEGCRHLDAACFDAADELCDKIAAFARDNGLDGLKIDFLDIVLPDTASPTGRNTLRIVKKLTGQLRADNPDALIEFRQRYATMAMLPYATQFRAADVPFDWMLNFNRLMNIRLTMGDNIPVHADPAYWADNEEAKNVSRHMISMLPAVPMLSVDPETLSDRDRQIVAYWINFYRENRPLLNHGHWQMLFGYRETEVAFVDNDRERLAIVCNHSRAAEIADTGDRQLKILNLSDNDIPLAEAETFAPDGTAYTTGVIPPGGWGIRR